MLARAYFCALRTSTGCKQQIQGCAYFVAWRTSWRVRESAPAGGRTHGVGVGGWCGGFAGCGPSRVGQRAAQPPSHSATRAVTAATARSPRLGRPRVAASWTRPCQRPGCPRPLAALPRRHTGSTATSIGRPVAAAAVPNDLAVAARAHSRLRNARWAAATLDAHTQTQCSSGRHLSSRSPTPPLRDNLHRRHQVRHTVRSATTRPPRPAHAQRLRR